MTLIEARRMFSLAETYTEEEVTRIYRKLMMKWHPDHNKSKDAESMSKQINEAKEILMKELKNAGSTFKTSYTNRTQTTYNRNSQTSFFVELLQKRVGTYNVDDLNFTLKSIIIEINTIIDKYKKTFAKDIFLSKLLYDVSNNEINKLLIKYIEWFCNYYNLERSSFYESIDYIILNIKKFSLMDIVNILEKLYFKVIHEKYCQELLNMIGFNNSNDAIDYDIIYPSDSIFKETYARLIKKVYNFKNSKFLKLRDLTNAYARCILYIKNETEKFVRDYCRMYNFKLVCKDGNYIVNDTVISSKENICVIYKMLNKEKNKKMSKRLSSIKAKDYNSKGYDYINDNIINKDYEKILKIIR